MSLAIPVMSSSPAGDSSPYGPAQRGTPHDRATSAAASRPGAARYDSPESAANQTPDLTPVSDPSGPEPASYRRLRTRLLLGAVTSVAAPVPVVMAAGAVGDIATPCEGVTPCLIKPSCCRTNDHCRGRVDTARVTP